LARCKPPEWRGGDRFVEVSLVAISMRGQERFYGSVIVIERLAVASHLNGRALSYADRMTDS